MRFTSRARQRGTSGGWKPSCLLASSRLFGRCDRILDRPDAANSPVRAGIGDSGSETTESSMRSRIGLGSFASCAFDTGAMSTDDRTAFDIAGQGRADAGPMIQAIRAAIRMVRARKPPL